MTRPFAIGDRVACRAVEGGPLVLGPYTIARRQERPDEVEVWWLLDDYEVEPTSTCPAHMMGLITPEEDLNLRVKDATARVDLALRLGFPWPVPRSAQVRVSISVPR